MIDEIFTSLASWVGSKSRPSSLKDMLKVSFLVSLIFAAQTLLYEYFFVEGEMTERDFIGVLIFSGVVFLGSFVILIFYRFSKNN